MGETVMADCNIFDEDEVCLVTPDKGFVYGLVLENSEYISSDEEENELHSDPFCDIVRRGAIRVAWHPDGKESIMPENKVILADRSLMPADVVRRLIKGQDSQRGFVQNMTVKCHVQILGTKKYICNIDSRELLPIQEWEPEPGDVVLDLWVGRIDIVNVDVTLRFPDGARCLIHDMDFFNFEDLSDRRGKNTEFVNRFYYPGQQLRGIMGDLVSVEWLVGTKAYNRSVAERKPKMNVIVMVEDVTTKNVEVHWICRGFSKSENSLSKPSSPSTVVRKDDLKRMQKLDWFGHCSIQIGDKAYYILKETDHLHEIAPRKFLSPDILSGESMNGCLVPPAGGEITRSATDSHRGGKVPPNRGNEQEMDCTSGDEEDIDLDEYEEEAGSDVGSLFSGDSSTSSSSRKKKRSAHRGPFLKTRMMRNVKGKRSKKKMVLPEKVLKPGDKVAVEVCYTFSTANVMWQDVTVETDIPSPELYPIHHLDDSEFFPGDFVLDAKDTETSDTYGVVVSCNHFARTCIVKWFKAFDIRKSNRPDEVIGPTEVSVYDIKDHPDYKFRPGHAVIRVGGADESQGITEAAGQVFQLDPQGQVVVKWPSGNITYCFPQELYIVGDEMSEISSDDSECEEEEEDDTDSSWETENEEEIDPDSEEAKLHLKNTHDLSWRIFNGHYEERKVYLDSLILRAQNVFAQLELLLRSLDSRMVRTTNYPHNILHIYSNCQDLDKLLKSSYFDDPDLTELILLIKTEMKMVRVVESISEGELINMNSDNLNVPVTIVSRNLGRNAAAEDCLAGSVGNGLNELCKAAHHDGSSSASCLPPVGNGPAWLQHRGVSIRVNNASDNSSSWGSLVVETKCSRSASSTVAADPERRSLKDLCLLVIKLLHDKLARIPKEMHRRWRKRGLDATKKFSCPDLLHKEKCTQTEPNCSVEEIDLLPGQGWFCITFPPKEVSVQASLQDMEQGTSGSREEKLEDDGQNLQRPSVTAEELLESTLASLMKSNAEQIEEEMALELDPSCATKGFQTREEAPLCHHFNNHQLPTFQKSFMAALRHEIHLLRTSLPDGILVQHFENRMDLFSFLIIGPTKTPYEDGLFIFDLQLPSDYPASPPLLYYFSYCSDRLNPNLYEDGKGNEVWTRKSNLLQVLVSIQGLILVREPYYNEAGYEKQRGSQQGLENSRLYNEMAVLKLVQSMINMSIKPHHIFEREIREHLSNNGPRMIFRLRKWLQLSERGAMAHPENCCDDGGAEGSSAFPDFPLLPASRGFCLTLRKHLEQFEAALTTLQKTSL